jgi:hypothetical protein
MILGLRLLEVFGAGHSIKASWRRRTLLSATITAGEGLLVLDASVSATAQGAGAADCAS